MLSVWLAKAVGTDRLTTGAAVEAPVPERLTVCGLPAALSVTVNVPVRVPWRLA